MLSGQMMNQALTITSIMNFAEQVFGDSEIVSVTADNPRHRYTYADAFSRTRQLANALAATFSAPWLRIRINKPSALPSAEAVGICIERGNKE